MEALLIIVGVVLFIINIVMIVKFFQIARNLERLTNLYVDGYKQIDGSNPEYYKLPLEKDIEKIERQKKEKERQEEIINKAPSVYYNSSMI